MMGNKPGGDKGKPLLLGGVPSSSSNGAAYHVTFEDQGDHETATLTNGSSPDAYYRPWSNGACTEGSFALDGSIKYFFTAQLSGCSIWVKTDKDHRKISILHEARTDAKSQQAHHENGFALIVDSNSMKKFGFSQEASQNVDVQKNEKTAVYFEAYAILDYEHKVMEFRIQMIQLFRDSKSENHYKLLDMKPMMVPLPS